MPSFQLVEDSTLLLRLNKVMNTFVQPRFILMKHNAEPVIETWNGTDKYIMEYDTHILNNVEESVYNEVLLEFHDTHMLYVEVNYVLHNKSTGLQHKTSYSWDLTFDQDENFSVDPFRGVMEYYWPSTSICHVKHFRIPEAPQHLPIKYM